MGPVYDWLHGCDVQSRFKFDNEVTCWHLINERHNMYMYVTDPKRQGYD